MEKIDKFDEKFDKFDEKFDKFDEYFRQKKLLSTCRRKPKVEMKMLKRVRNRKKSLKHLWKLSSAPSRNTNRLK
jgi:hypothetical protein